MNYTGTNITFKDFDAFTLNYTDIYSDFQHPDPYSSMYILRQIAIPIICVLGFVGNVLTAVVYFSKEMRKLSCSFYLGIRAISDNGCILTIFLAWLDFVNVRVFHMTGLCQATVFISYVCGFISVWCVVFITVENFIMICRPVKVSKFCKVKIARKLIIITTLIGILWFNYPLWGMTVDKIGGKEYCTIRSGNLYSRMEFILVYSDTVITLILPVTTIIVLLIRITKQLFSTMKNFSNRQARRISTDTMTLPTSSPAPRFKVIKLLSSVSILFLLLHTPNHVLRLKVTIENFINSFRISTDVERSLQYVFSLLFYLNYAVNWIIHVAIGSKFRRVLSSKFCCCSTADIYGNDTNTCESRQDTRNSMVSMQKYSRSSTASVRKYSRNSAVSMRKYSRNSTVSIRKCSRNSAVSIGKYSQGSLSRTRRHSSRSSGEVHFAMTSNTLQTEHTENLMDTKSRLCVPQ